MNIPSLPSIPPVDPSSITTASTILDYADGPTCSIVTDVGRSMLGSNPLSTVSYNPSKPLPAGAINVQAIATLPPAQLNASHWSDGQFPFSLNTSFR